KLLKFTPNRVNKALFPLNAIEKFRFGSTLAAVKLMILQLSVSSSQNPEKENFGVYQYKMKSFFTCQLPSGKRLRGVLLINPNVQLPGRTVSLRHKDSLTITH
ncbi:hypothetical protein, partial [Dialister sp.]|uniref:hypothetical protein n=1 Tax=Dialister sp. TaxID=1955814 RepID=UPI002E805FEB